MPKKKITDHRILEACEGREVDSNTATPLELARAYAGWTLGDPQWANVFIDVLKAAGFQVKG